MSTMHDPVAEYEKILIKADDYHHRALWQEKLCCLQEALAICNQPDFPNAQLHKQELLCELGGIRRRFGQYDQAEKELQLALQVFTDTEPLKRARILGELGVVLRHRGKLEDARDTFRAQYRLAADAGSDVEADAEKCRAIGNEGRAAYNIWRSRRLADRSLLDTAFAQTRERIQRSQDLQRRIQATEMSASNSSKYLALAKTWELIGLDNLSLCHIAAGQTADAVRVLEGRQENADPSVRAFSRFFHGNALWAAGRQEEAGKQWSAPNGTCNSVIALSKESSDEYVEYVELMADAGIDFDSFDEQGFTALDYAVLNDQSDGRDVIPIILKTLSNALRAKIQEDVPKLTSKEVQDRVNVELSLRQHQAQLRRQYRVILQEHLRPALRTANPDPIMNLRTVYSNFLAEIPEEKHKFSDFFYVKYTDFVSHGRLPTHNANTSQSISDRPSTKFLEGNDDFVIFFSYRWLAETVPDDEQRTQWHRMRNAVDEFLKMNNHVRPEKLGIWLDYACIDQENEESRQRGIDSLPLAIALCNAMISLVDAHYYERAWCVVEVMLMRALLQSHAHNIHQWWEHELTSPDVDRCQGSLKKGELNRNFDLTKLKLTKEEIDRPKVDFLLRQSKLLGKDDIF